MLKLERISPLCILIAFGSSLAACGSDGADDTNGGGGVQAVLALTGDASRGQTLFADNCAICHGDNGTGVGDIGPDLTAALPMLTDEQAVDVIYNGSDTEPTMIAWSEELTDQQIADVHAYIRTLVP